MPESEYASEVAAAIHRLCDVGELIADGLFAVAAGTHTSSVGDHRNMTAVFVADAKSNYGDVWKKLGESERQRLECFIQDICKRRK